MSNILHIIMCPGFVYVCVKLRWRQAKVKSVDWGPPKKGKYGLPINTLSLLLSWMAKGLLYRQSQEMKTIYNLHFSSDFPYITGHPAVQTLCLAYTSCFKVSFSFTCIVASNAVNVHNKRCAPRVSTVFAHLCICVNTEAHIFHVGVTSLSD